MLEDKIYTLEEMRSLGIDTHEYVFMDQPGIPVFECGFEKAWEYVKQERDKLFLPSECTKCGKRAFCTVCGACAYTETGDFQKRPDYMCAMTMEKLRLMAAYADEELSQQIT